MLLKFYRPIMPVVLLTVMALTMATAGATVKATAAPNFVIKDNQQLSDLKGKVVYLDFWASWCGPCRKSFPWMNKIHQQYHSDNFVVISINLDQDVDAAKKFLDKYPAQFSVTFNPSATIAEQYQVKGMPSSYLIDRQGNIAFAHVGFFSQKVARYQQQIEQLIGQKQP